jgi:cell wall-associated NlpC family hydrolase
MEIVSKNWMSKSGWRFSRLLALCVLPCALWLGGCAPKRPVAPPVAPPVAVNPAPPVSDVLRMQYETWKGVRHRLGGVDKRGVDCSGLVQSVFRDAFRVELPRTSAEQSRVGRSVPRGDIRPGDLVYFYDKNGDHIGVVVENRTFLHASATFGVMLSDLDAYWLPRLKRVQRVLSS